MRTDDLDFQLPAEAIAQYPADPRDSCLLMHLEACGRSEHYTFSDLPDLLEPGDVLVLNDSRVLPARLTAFRPGGGETEVLLVRPVATDMSSDCTHWEALVRPSKRLRPGMELRFADGTRLCTAKDLGEGRWVLSGPGGMSMADLMRVNGRLPLPPYIKTYPQDPESYQTVYASAPGSAAAPTAGLHFTRKLLDDLDGKGICIAFVTLHVGLDTFLPIRERVVEEHAIHSESYEVPPETLAKIEAARDEGHRVVAVGTTSARVLETLAVTKPTASSSSEGIRGNCSLFITPGYEFQGVDALLTNFHLPRSTVLALTMAFAGVDRLLRAYAVALTHGYRFFSFGDAMLIERSAAGPGSCAYGDA